MAKELSPYLLENTFTQSGNFKSEKLMCNMLDDNMKDFVVQYLNEKYLKHIREYKIGQTDFIKLGFVRPRIDFLVKTEDERKIGIECKNCKSRSTGYSDGIIQLLQYNLSEERQSGKGFDRLILIVSSFDPIFENIVNRYKLPVEILYFNKEQIGKIQWNQN